MFKARIKSEESETITKNTKMIFDKLQTRKTICWDGNERKME
jgi:hypothetical protein